MKPIGYEYMRLINNPIGEPPKDWLPSLPKTNGPIKIIHLKTRIRLLAEYADHKRECLAWGVPSHPMPDSRPMGGCDGDCGLHDLLKQLWREGLIDRKDWMPRSENEPANPL